MYDIFISYAREDWDDFTRPLYLALLNLELEIWLDLDKLKLGKPVNKDIKKSIEESKYGIALLTENYFKIGKKKSTLYELELFKKKHEKSKDFILPVVCGYIEPILGTREYTFLNEPYRIYWKEGIITVIKAIAKEVKPELQNSNIELMLCRQPPIPPAQPDAVVLIRIYKDAGRNQEASEIALKYLDQHPKDPNISKLYLNSVGATNNKLLISEAIGKFLKWLKENPDDRSVRDNFISFVKQKRVKYAEMVIDDISEWLKNNDNINIKAGYLSLVLEKGSFEQVKRAIAEGKEWLLENDNSLVRIPYFQLVVNRGNSEEIKEIVKETMRWLDINQKDSNLRTVYIKYLKDNGDHKQKRDAIEMCEKWLRENKNDNFLRPTYLDLVEDYKDQKYIDSAFDYTQNWLTLHERDIRVREKYIKFVQCIGTPKQIAKTIKETKNWLEEMEKMKGMKQKTNVQISLLRLVEYRGINDQVTAEINDTLEWLKSHEGNTNVRASLLDLIKAKCSNESLKDSLFEDYIDWLNRNKNGEKSAEVRRRFIDYITQVGNYDQKMKVINDTEIWLNDHDKNFMVKRSLNELKRSLSEKVN
jgi:tetratricopeptide (TPR) repeat protein